MRKILTKIFFIETTFFIKIKHFKTYLIHRDSFYDHRLNFEILRRHITIDNMYWNKIWLEEIEILFHNILLVLSKNLLPLKHKNE